MNIYGKIIRNKTMQDYPEIFQQNPVLLYMIIAWTLTWKGLALWQASKNSQKYWFIALLVLNTVGLAEIVYLTWFAKKNRYWDKIVKGKTWKKPKSSSTKRT
ncbi:DUF5652 family protein [Patescibacteria group bacterium]